MTPEFEQLVTSLNAEHEDFLFTRRTKKFVLAMNEAARNWDAICAAQCSEEFMKRLTFVRDTTDPRDKWSRMRTWALLPVVMEFQDKQAKRGWSVWREISKIVKTAGEQFVREKYASGEWGPDLTREQLDRIVGNAKRHHPKRPK